MEKNYTSEKTFEFNGDNARKLLAIYGDRRAWRSLTFLFLTFPLGILYFVGLVTGFSVGAGLAVTLVGLPILVAVFYMAGWATQFEAWFHNRMIGANVEPTVYEYEAEGFFGKLGAALRDVNRWRGIGWLFLRFPLGIGAFVAGNVLFCIPFALITAPFTYTYADINIAFWTVNSFGGALLASVIGVFAGALALHVAVWITGVWRGLIEAILGESEKSKRKNDDLLLEA